MFVADASLPIAQLPYLPNQGSNPAPALRDLTGWTDNLCHFKPAIQSGKQVLYNQYVTGF